MSHISCCFSSTKNTQVFLIDLNRMKTERQFYFIVHCWQCRLTITILCLEIEVLRNNWKNENELKDVIQHPTKLSAVSEKIRIRTETALITSNSERISAEVLRLQLGILKSVEIRTFQKTKGSFGEFF